MQFITFNACKLSCKFISWVSRNSKMSNCIVFFAVPITVETAMEALPLQAIYLFNLDGHDHFVNMS